MNEWMSQPAGEKAFVSSPTNIKDKADWYNNLQVGRLAGRLVSQSCDFVTRQSITGYLWYSMYCSLAELSLNYFQFCSKTVLLRSFNHESRPFHTPAVWSCNFFHGLLKLKSQRPNIYLTLRTNMYKITKVWVYLSKTEWQTL